jgi:hypothetical protein
MPTLGDRSAFNYAMLAIPVAALACALAGLTLSLHRLWRQQETALDVIVIAGAFALATTFAIHVSYSYGRYVRDWMADGRLPALLPAAHRDRAAGVSVISCRDRVAALAQRTARIPGHRSRHFSAFSAHRSASLHVRPTPVSPHRQS